MGGPPKLAAYRVLMYIMGGEEEYGSCLHPRAIALWVFWFLNVVGFRVLGLGWGWGVGGRDY